MGPAHTRRLPLQREGFQVVHGPPYPTSVDAAVYPARASRELGQQKNIHYSDVPSTLQDLLWDDFERMLGPFGATGKLGVVLFQFAPWFRPFRQSFEHIHECKRRLPGHRIAVEFRNCWWLHPDYFEQTLGFLRDNEIEYVAVDEPQGSDSSVPPLAEVTARLGIIRFRGRNEATWEKKGLKSSAQRFDYY